MDTKSGGFRAHGTRYDEKAGLEQQVGRVSFINATFSVLSGIVMLRFTVRLFNATYPFFAGSNR